MYAAAVVLIVAPVLLCAQSHPTGPAQPGPCGHFGQAPCGMEAAAPPVSGNASADELFAAGNQAYAQGQYGRSFAFFQRAAAMGHTRAQASLGLAFYHGTGTPKDLTQAIVWLTKAADKGHRVAQLQLGDIYEDGEGIPVDHARSFHYHRLSAEQGFWQGANRLGLDYEFGWGTPHNRALAIQWLRRAVEDGDDTGWSGRLLSLLSRADAPKQFHSVEEIGTFENGVNSVRRASPGGAGCPGNAIETSPGEITVFCSEHPGCPFTNRVFGPQRCK